MPPAEIPRTEIAVIGGGPAGMRAAAAAASAGASVTIIDRNARLGGQLVKQTHKFFGSARQYASVRGIEIAGILEEELESYGAGIGGADRTSPGMDGACVGTGAGTGTIDIMLDSTAIGLYGDRVLTIERGKEYRKLKPDRIVIAAGASEKFLPFPNNDLPGIYGAGAVQTIMNLYGVMPGMRAVVLGAGNIGLIVSYQLLQAGVEVSAVVEASPRIGGYLVHASKIRRAGVPIYTSTTIANARGTDRLEGVTLCGVDEKWNRVPGSEFDIEADLLCVAVGLSPLTELLWQAGCEMRYIPEFGGHVPVRNDLCETSVPGIFAAGDAAGIEEASSAMVEGKMAGLCAAMSLGYGGERFEIEMAECRAELASLRNGPTGEKIRKGIIRLGKERENA